VGLAARAYPTGIGLIMGSWQDIAALGLVALALGYLGRSALGAVSGRRPAGGGCGSGCGGCPSGREAGPDGRGEPLVSLGPPPRPSHRDSLAESR
jgi:hypothetical protein